MSITGKCIDVCLIVFNATFNNISAISWRSLLVVISGALVLEIFHKIAE